MNGPRAFSPPPFPDRPSAGRALARQLRTYANRDDVVVLALPRGGVPVAAEVASALQAPLDVLLVRKLGVPGHEELAMGSIAEGGVAYLNEALVRDLGIPPEAVAQVTSTEQVELRRREELYRHGRQPVDVRDRQVIVVDDGLATGATMMVAVRVLRSRGPRTIVVATPVASRQALELLQPWVDACIAVATPEPFYAIGAWYTDFGQTSDAEVGNTLAAARGAA